MAHPFRVLFTVFIMAGATAAAQIPNNDTTTVGEIELRDYLIKPGERDRFISYFEANFIESQRVLGGYVLGGYRVKNNPDNFFWMRGFRNMETRSAFLPAFYYGPFWRQHRAVPNGLLLNNDNVYLLKPLRWEEDSLVPTAAIPSGLLKQQNGIAVVDFYISNTKLDKLLQIFARQYLPMWQECGITRYTLWVSEMRRNDFPALPVFQDKNLLVTISFFRDEADYEEKMHLLQSKANPAFLADFLDAMTTKNTLILYPTGLKH